MRLFFPIFFHQKGPQFTNTLTFWSPFAIFEPLTCRRLGPVPACLFCCATHRIRIFYRESFSVFTFGNFSLSSNSLCRIHQFLIRSNRVKILQQIFPPSWEFFHFSPGIFRNTSEVQVPWKVPSLHPRLRFLSLSILVKTEVKKTKRLRFLHYHQRIHLYGFNTLEQPEFYCS